MRRPRGHRRCEWPDNNEILRRRYGEESRPAHHRVILGHYAFIKGWLVAFGSWFAFSLIVSIVDEVVSPGSYALSLWGVILMFSFFFAAFLGAPFALLLGLLLRPVRRQWMHVAGFSAGMGALTWVATAALLPGAHGLPAVFAAIAAAASGIGRTAVIADVDIYDDRTGRNTETPGAGVVSEDPRLP